MSGPYPNLLIFNVMVKDFDPSSEKWFHSAFLRVSPHDSLASRKVSKYLEEQWGIKITRVNCYAMIGDKNICMSNTVPFNYYNEKNCSLVWINMKPREEYVGQIDIKLPE